MKTASAKQSGFTLVELVIAIALIALLTAIALPSYKGYILRSHRTTAKAMLNQLAARQEAYFSDHKTYASSFDALGYATNAKYLSADGVLVASSTGSRYEFKVGTGSLPSACAVTGTPTTTFSIAAEPLGNQKTNDPCGTLCISSAGERGVSKSTNAECWGR